MDPVRLKGYTPDEFERICLDLVRQAFNVSAASRRGSISDPDQGIDIEATSGTEVIGVQCKTGKVTVPLLRESLRQLVHYPQRLDRFILMCAQHPMPRASDELRRWSVSAETVAGPIPVVELWDPDRVALELDAHPSALTSISRSTATAVFAVPSPRSTIFVGRHEALAKLDEWNDARTVAGAVSVVGMGGVGKTTLAIEYAHSRRSRFPGGVYWFNAQESLIPQCARLALMNGSATSDTVEAAAAGAFLSSFDQSKKALVILDDLDQPTLIAEPIADARSLVSTGARILITSRFAGLVAGGVRRLALEALSEGEALELLARSSNRPGLRDPGSRDHQAGLELCRELGFLPLAVQIAGSFLALHPQASIHTYLLSFEVGGTAGIDVTEVAALHLRDFRHASLSASLRLAYDAIRDDGARRLFHVLCMLPPDVALTRATLPFLLGEPDGVGTGIQRSLAWLVNSGLVQVDSNDQVLVHPLTRSFGAALLSDDQRREFIESIGEASRRNLPRLLTSNDPRVEQQRAERPTVFLCYAGPDGETVRRLYYRLSGDGVIPWMDKKSLLPGEDWRREIKRAIEAADFFVACISRRFSEKTYANKELRVALEVMDMMPEGAIFVIPVRLEDCPVPDRLASKHWVDLFADDGYEKLVRVIGAKRKW